jgi:uncharacterized protein YggE
MDKSVNITLIIAGTLVLLALIGVWASFQLSPYSQTNTISSNGAAEISAVPDKVSLYFNVETKGNDSKTANDKNAEIVDNLITALVKEGFERKDIQTMNYNIYEDFQWTQSGRNSLGWKAVHTVTVKMPTSQTDKIGDAIDAGVNSGAALSYINFELSQELENQYKAQAIRLAAEDAKLKAQALAEGSGNELGKLVSISNQEFGYQPWRVYDYAADASMEQNVAAAKSATSIQPGEQTITAQVSVVYKIN